MRALAAASLILVLVTGCGGVSDEPRAGCSGAPPAAPRITAVWNSGRIVVDYEIPAAGCRPWAIHVTGRSKEKLDNMAPGEGAGGPTRLEARHGRVVLKEPPLRLPPYQALASTVAPNGRRSRTVVVRVAGAPVNACRRSHGRATCIARAQRTFERCLRGEGPRSACAEWIYRTRPPLAMRPIEDATREQVRRSFADVAARIACCNVSFVRASCTRASRCVAVWHGAGGLGGTFRARFDLTGDQYNPGCWQVAERHILDEPSDPPILAPIRHVLQPAFTGCVAGAP
jgi:hypothetical protein